MPYTKSVTETHHDQRWPNPPFISYTRSWNTQPKPYHAALEFSFQKWYCNSYTADQDGLPSYPGAFSVPWISDWDHPHNKAYGSLVDQVGNQSQWANNLLEARESIGTVEHRLLQLARVASDLRKGHLGSALNNLGAPNVPKASWNKLKRAKSFGDQWLELHFGWVPAVQDISAGLNVLSKSDFGSKRVRSSCTVSNVWNYRDGGNVPDKGTFRRIDVKNVITTKMGAKIRISNPNAYLANQFGVANPASVAWEAVPYSFVVDWFANVGQCINAMTDFLGLEVQDSYTTRFARLSRQYADENLNGGVFSGVRYSDSTVGNDRVASFSGPVLEVKPFKGFSLERGATAVALLLQKL